MKNVTTMSSIIDPPACLKLKDGNMCDRNVQQPGLSYTVQ